MKDVMKFLFAGAIKIALLATLLTLSNSSPVFAAGSDACKSLCRCENRVSKCKEWCDRFSNPTPGSDYSSDPEEPRSCANDCYESCLKYGAGHHPSCQKLFPEAENCNCGRDSE